MPAQVGAYNAWGGKDYWCGQSLEATRKKTARLEQERPCHTVPCYARWHRRCGYKHVDTTSTTGYDAYSIKKHHEEDRIVAQHCGAVPPRGPGCQEEGAGVGAVEARWDPCDYAGGCGRGVCPACTSECVCRRDAAHSSSVVGEEHHVFCKHCINPRKHFCEGNRVPGSYIE